MSSHRLKRAKRGAMTVAAVIAVVAFSPSPAYAQPPAPPTTASEALKQYQELSKQAEKVNEDLLKAQTDLEAKRVEFDKATNDVALAAANEKQALALEEQFRGQVDLLASASFQGARFNKISALLTGSSPDDFLERASALNVLAEDNQEALAKYTGAVNTAADARKLAEDGQRRASEAKAAAEKLAADVTKTRDDLQAQIKTVEAAKNRLSAKEKTDLQGPKDDGVYLAPPGAAGKAMEVALAQRGKPYVWGAEGPGSYDCSGLVLYAYRAAGVSLPHSSRAQYGYGKSVSRSELQPGDLLFYGGSASSIHHVAMYIGDGRIVHASTSGVPVKTDTIDGGGRDYLGAKRIVG
ncbi:cell wall-associated NlpC family hydrolase [Actinokineospora baliensis]|uniref:C40 family peptidase n=1 Tax=Actinokineospora baliensis TaxID=547056 RepID=UPI001955FC89|nr:C40 family peptidase [Actinokineospora baliensis]MBM7776435.1 cell wall-associated NlpC family hydrolase [Actinokineospora baliensis]